MRIIVIALCLTTAACGSAAAPSSEPIAPVTFENASATDTVAKIKHGARLSWVLGCRGCHGKDLQGRKFDDDPQGYGVVWASNLTRAVPGMTDAQLDALLRRGVHPERTEMWLMPSENFQHLSDADTASLIAYLRSLQPAGEPSPPPFIGPKAKEEIAAGAIKTAATLVQETKLTQPVGLGSNYRLGRYIATVTCAECHGLELEGQEGGPPDLMAAGAYTRTEFETLMTKGVPAGNRKLKALMQDVAKNRYSRLTTDERDALYAYLRARAERPQ